MWPGYEKRIDHLKAGRALIMTHEVYGKYRFYLNPQQNCLIAYPIDDRAKANEKKEIINRADNVVYPHPDRIDGRSGNAEKFVLWGHGDWEVELEKPSIRTIVIEEGGKYEKL